MAAQIVAEGTVTLAHNTPYVLYQATVAGVFVLHYDIRSGLEAGEGVMFDFATTIDGEPKTAHEELFVIDSPPASTITRPVPAAPLTLTAVAGAPGTGSVLTGFKVFRL